MRNFYFNRMGSALVLALLAAPHFEARAAESPLRTAQIKDDIVVYREPKETSESLGKFRKGTTIKVYFPDRNGWYATYFQKPIKGAVYGWMKADQIEIKSDSARPAASASSEPKHAPAKNRSSRVIGTHWISLGGGLHMLSPTEVQNALGVVNASTNGLNFNLEYGQRIGERWIGWARAGKLSFTGTVASATSPAPTYTASSNSVILGVGYLIIRQPSTSLSLDLGAGAGLGSAGNTNADNSISTSPIVTLPILARVSFRYALIGSFGLGMEAGIRKESLGNISFLTLPSGTTQIEANTSLTGPYGGAALSYLF